MKLAELEALFRSDVNDTAKPFLFSSADVGRWFNEAQEEAALRANLLVETTDPDICRIVVKAGTRSYDLHPLVFFVQRATFTADDCDEPIELRLTDRIELSQRRPNWRTNTEQPRALIVDDTTVEVGCLPEADGVIDLEVYRAPLKDMTAEDSPEINRAHHRHLAKWVEHRAYGRPDTETYDAQRSERAEAEFTRQFGNRPDADMRRALQSNTPAHNTAY